MTASVCINFAKYVFRKEILQQKNMYNVETTL